jgi:hypothetical protein
VFSLGNFVYSQSGDHFEEDVQKSGDHPYENLAKYGYKSDLKYKF